MVAFFLFLTLAIAIAPAASADDAIPRAFIPNTRPVLGVTPLEGTIRIDGRLDDDGWRFAVHAGNFAETQPGDQVRPPANTDVYLTYDATHLYIAFVAHDANPASIRSSLRERDQIFDDDYIGVVIDTYNNAAWCYELFANPFGIQGDMRWTPTGEDIGFDVVFESKGQITDQGYQVEMAIPFKSLRFPNKAKQNWRATFTRVHPRDSERRYSWATISRDNPCYPCQFGTISGIEGVRAGGSLELLPSVVGFQSAALRDAADPNSGFERDDPDGEVSLGARYAITPSTAAELTINPDFSQVESDVAQIDVNTTFALFFPERRPFFQEGSDLYSSSYNLIYTRQINDPSVAAKLTSRADRTSAVYLFGRDEETPLILPFKERSLLAAPGKSVSNVFRIKHTYGEDSFLGAAVTDRRYDAGGSGTVFSADGNYRFSTNYRLEAQFAGTRTREPDDTLLTDGQHAPDATFDDGAHTMALDGESFSGYGAYASFEREARRWNTDVDVWASSPTFRADNGFVTRNGDHLLSWNNHYLFYPNNSVLDRVRPQVYLWRRWESNSRRRGRAIENTVDIIFKGQTSLTIGYDNSSERFRETYFDGIDLYYGEVNTAYWENLQLGFWLGVGDRIARTAQPRPFLGKGEHLDVWGTIKMGNRFVLEPVFTYSTIRHRVTGEDFFKGWIGRMKVNFQFTRELFMRFVAQYDDFGGELTVEPLLSYELNPFTVFYVGASVFEQDFGHKSFDPGDRTGDGIEPTAWQLFFKLQYFYRL